MSSSTIPLVAWPLGAGLLVNTSVFFGIGGIGVLGPVAIVREKLGKTDLSAKDKVRVWSLFFKRAAIYIVGGIASSTVLNLISAYLAPSSTTLIISSTAGPSITSTSGSGAEALLSVRSLALTAAAASATVIPYTLLFIQPTNKRLLELDEKKGDLTPAENKEVEGLLDDWEKLHRVRFVPYSLAWLASAWAFALVLRS